MVSKANNPPYSGESLSKYTDLIAIRNAGVLNYFSFCQIRPVPAKTLTDCIRACLAALPEDTILSWQAGIIRFYVSGRKSTEQKSPCRKRDELFTVRMPVGTPVAVSKLIVHNRYYNRSRGEYRDILYIRNNNGRKLQFVAWALFLQLSRSDPQSVARRPRSQRIK